MRGLTFIEVLVAMGIATVAGVLLLAIIINSFGLSQNQSSKVETGLNINDALSIFRSAVKQSTGVDNASGGNSLILKVPSVDSLNNIIEDKVDFFQLFQEGNLLRFRVTADQASSRNSEDRILSTSLDNLIFRYPDPSKVEMTLVLKQTTATTEANLRND